MNAVRHSVTVLFLINKDEFSVVIQYSYENWVFFQRGCDFSYNLY